MSLKVFDLHCEHGHTFEGWFNASQPFDKQLSNGMVTCPMCGSTDIVRKLSAPRINLGRGKPSASENTANNNTDNQVSMQSDNKSANSADLALPSPEQIRQIQAKILGHMRAMVKNSEDVGDRFTAEAIKMHKGEVAERPIKGTATTEERQQLKEEGVSVMPLPKFLEDDKLH